MDQEDMYTAPVGLRFFVGGFSPAVGLLRGRLHHRLHPGHGRSSCSCRSTWSPASPPAASRAEVASHQGGLVMRKTSSRTMRARSSRPACCSPAAALAQTASPSRTRPATTTARATTRTRPTPCTSAGSFDITDFTVEGERQQGGLHGHGQHHPRGPLEDGRRLRRADGVHLHRHRTARKAAASPTARRASTSQFAPADAWDKLVILSPQAPARVKPEVEAKAAALQGGHRRPDPHQGRRPDDHRHGGPRRSSAAATRRSGATRW